MKNKLLFVDLAYGFWWILLLSGGLTRMSSEVLIYHKTPLWSYGLFFFFLDGPFCTVYLLLVIWKTETCTFIMHCTFICTFTNFLFSLPLLLILFLVCMLFCIARIFLQCTSICYNATYQASEAKTFLILKTAVNGDGQ